MAIEWREELATGNGLIDDQHKELFKRFNNLLAACNQGKGKEEVGNLLLFLGDYVRSHFAMEEELQKKHGYPEYQAHKAEHEGFIRDLHSLENESRDSGTGVALVIQTNQMMAGWLIKHISGTDKKLANFLHAAM
ncbi:MAG TPA: bacteriohemerythrin [Geobacteraceae bacterium]